MASGKWIEAEHWARQGAWGDASIFSPASHTSVNLSVICENVTVEVGSQSQFRATFLAPRANSELRFWL